MMLLKIGILYIYCYIKGSIDKNQNFYNINAFLLTIHSVQRFSMKIPLEVTDLIENPHAKFQVDISVRTEVILVLLEEASFLGV